jgi:NAD(P)-dependent dehydrogenase (short-subunit alcohol dehydrogenase family)
MKTLVITGGTGGLGTFIVERLRRNYECVLLNRPEVDLLDATSVLAALAKVRHPYGLVHMAGGWEGGVVSETSEETWSKMIGLNLTSSFHAIRETLARMNREEPGRIVAISSISSITKDAKSAAYTISKSALNTLIEVTAAELRGTQITVNALLPNTLATPANNGEGVPLERVADTIEFLLSDAGARVTGALIPLR